MSPPPHDRRAPQAATQRTLDLHSLPPRFWNAGTLGATSIHAQPPDDHRWLPQNTIVYGCMAPPSREGTWRAVVGAAGGTLPSTPPGPALAGHPTRARMLFDTSGATDAQGRETRPYRTATATLNGLHATEGARWHGIAVPEGHDYASAEEAYAALVASPVLVWHESGAAATRPGVARRFLQYGHGEDADDWDPHAELPAAHPLCAAWDRLRELIEVADGFEHAQQEMFRLPAAQAVCDYFEPAGWVDEFGDELLDASGSGLNEATLGLLSLQHTARGEESYVDLDGARRDRNAANARIGAFAQRLARASAALRGALSASEFIEQAGAFVRRSAANASWVAAFLRDALQTLDLHDSSEDGQNFVRDGVTALVDTPANGPPQSRLGELARALDAMAADFRPPPLRQGQAPASGGSPPPQDPDAVVEEAQHLNDFQAWLQGQEAFIGTWQHRVKYALAADRVAARQLFQSGYFDFARRRCGNRALEFMRRGEHTATELYRAHYRRLPHAANMDNFLRQHGALGSFRVMRGLDQVNDRLVMAQRYLTRAEEALKPVDKLAAVITGCNKLEALAFVGFNVFRSPSDATARETQKMWCELYRSVLEAHEEALAEIARHGRLRRVSLTCARFVAAVAGGYLAYLDYAEARRELAAHGYTAALFQHYAEAAGGILEAVGEAIALIPFPQAKLLGGALAAVGKILSDNAETIGAVIEFAREHSLGPEALEAEGAKRAQVLCTQYAAHPQPFFAQVRILPGNREERLRVEATLPFRWDEATLRGFIARANLTEVYCLVRYAGDFGFVSWGSAGRDPVLPLTLQGPRPGDDPFFVRAVLCRMQPKAGAPGTWEFVAAPASVAADPDARDLRGSTPEQVEALASLGAGRFDWNWDWAITDLQFSRYGISPPMRRALDDLTLLRRCLPSVTEHSRSVPHPGSSGTGPVAVPLVAHVYAVYSDSAASTGRPGAPAGIAGSILGRNHHYDMLPACLGTSDVMGYFPFGASPDQTQVWPPDADWASLGATGGLANYRAPPPARQRERRRATPRYNTGPSDTNPIGANDE